MDTHSPLHLSDRLLRVGFLPLVDAAPIIAAHELGYFRDNGLRVALSREPGWATLRDKVVQGELDAAHALAGLLWAVRLGIDCQQAAVLTGMVLNLHGNAITLSNALWRAGVRDGAALRGEARRRRGERKLTLGIVFPISAHSLFLRAWLRAHDIDPVRDVRLVVLPPAQMFRNLAAGTIDGYCVGEPWNSMAILRGAGWCPEISARFMPGHLEKVLMVTEAFAERRKEEHLALIQALYRAALWCDEAGNRRSLSTLLSERRYLNVPESLIAPSLTGPFPTGTGTSLPSDQFLVFHRQGAGNPSRARADAFQRSLTSAGLLPEIKSPDFSSELFREDIHAEALATLSSHACQPV